MYKGLKMEEDRKAIPYYAYDALSLMANRTNRRLWILCIILIVLLFGTNMGWVIYESQFEEVSTTQRVEQEAEWDSESEVIMNGTGVINYGESKTDGNNDNEDTQAQDRR